MGWLRQNRRRKPIRAQGFALTEFEKGHRQSSLIGVKYTSLDHLKTTGSVHFGTRAAYVRWTEEKHTESH